MKMNDTIKGLSETTPNNSIFSDTNWLIWIVLLEFIIIIYLIIKLKSKPEEKVKQKFKKESLEKVIDFNNIINSSFNSKELYDSLKVKCHPDLFPFDESKKTIAEKLFQEITENQNNAKRLLELKEDVKQKLKINI